MAIHSSIFAWRILWTEKSGRLQSVGSQRVRHDWATNIHTHTHTHTHTIGSDTNSNVSDGGGFPFQQAILGTPGRYPTNQLNFDALSRNIIKFHGYKLSPTRLLPLSLEVHMLVKRQSGPGSRHVTGRSGCSGMTLRDGVGRGGGREVQDGGHNPWLIHVNVWQKPLQYYN